MCLWHNEMEYFSCRGPGGMGPVRGGGFGGNDRDCMSARRDYLDPWNRGGAIGFRLSLVFGETGYAYDQFQK